MKKRILKNISMWVLVLAGTPLPLKAIEVDLTTPCPTPRSQIRKRNLAQDNRYTAMQLIKKRQYKEAIPLLKEALDLNGSSAPLKEINNLAEIYARTLQESQAQALNYSLSQIIACRYVEANKQYLAVSFPQEAELTPIQIAEFYDHILEHIQKENPDYLMILRGAAYAYYRAENYLRASRIWQIILDLKGYQENEISKRNITDLRGAALAFYENKNYEKAATLFNTYFGRLKDFHSKINLRNQEAEVKEYFHKNALAHTAIKSSKTSELFIKYFESIELEEISFADLEEAFCSWTKKTKFPRALANHYWKNVDIDDLSPQKLRFLISYLMTYEPDSFHLPMLHDCLFEWQNISIRQLDVIRAFTTFHKEGSHDKALEFWKLFNPELSRKENNLGTDLWLTLNRMAAQSFYATFDYQSSAALYDKIIETKKLHGIACSKDLYKDAIEAHKKSRHLKRVVSLHMSKSFRVRDKKSLTF